MMMKVKKIIWDGKQNSDAEAIITDGEHECLVFCYPCNISEGKILSEPLTCFMTENIMRSYNNKSTLVKDSDSYFGYTAIAQLISKKQGTVKLGGFTMELDGYIPPDLENGEFIEFKCSRIDVQE